MNALDNVFVRTLQAAAKRALPVMAAIGFALGGFGVSGHAEANDRANAALLAGLMNLGSQYVNNEPGREVSLVEAGAGAGLAAAVAGNTDWRVAGLVSGVGAQVVRKAVSNSERKNSGRQPSGYQATGYQGSGQNYQINPRTAMQINPSEGVQPDAEVANIQRRLVANLASAQSGLGQTVQLYNQQTRTLRLNGSYETAPRYEVENAERGYQGAQMQAMSAMVAQHADGYNVVTLHRALAASLNGEKVQASASGYSNVNYR